MLVLDLFDILFSYILWINKNLKIIIIMILILINLNVLKYA